MHFILYRRYISEERRALLKVNFFFIDKQAACPVAVVLYHACDYYVQVHGVKHFLYCVYMAQAAVYEYYVRHAREACIALLRSPETPVYDLLHAAVIVRSVYCLYLELSV